MTPEAAVETALKTDLQATAAVADNVNAWRFFWIDDETAEDGEAINFPQCQVKAEMAIIGEGLATSDGCWTVLTTIGIHTYRDDDRKRANLSTISEGVRDVVDADTWTQPTGFAIDGAEVVGTDADADGKDQYAEMEVRFFIRSV